MIGVAGCVWGDYHQYVERWYQSVLAADASQIVLVTDQPRPDIPCDQIVNPVHTFTHQEAAWWNAGVAALETEWVSTLGVDDEVYPDAYTDLQEDVTLLGMRLVGEDGKGNALVTAPYDRGMDYVVNKTMVVAHCSPIRRTVFPGYKDMAYCDTRIYLDAARSGARFYNPKKIGLKHYQRPGSLSFGYAEDGRFHQERLWS